MIIELNTQYVVDVLGHVAEPHGVSQSISSQEAQEALERFSLWAEKVERSWPEIDYCEFAAFFATEVAQGRLYPEISPLKRIKIGLELLTHLTLEGNLVNRKWEVVLDGLLDTIADILNFPHSLPEDTLRLQRYVPCE